MSPIRFLLMILAAGILLPAAASAHMLWINASDFAPDAGQEVYVRIGWGHEYPRDQMVNPDIVDEVKVLGSGGQQVETQRIFPDVVRFTPKSKGTYRVLVQIKPGFVSKTPTGHKLGNKKELDNAVTCFRHNMTAKAIIQSGDSAATGNGQDGLALQLVPLKDPSELSPGDKLPVRALFQGEPQSGVTVKSTSRGHDGEWVSEKKTDKEGIARFEIDGDGAWMFRAEHRTPYPDETVCDQYFYTSALNVSF
ncbi:MAG: DUF4198 domain-containing protein [Desulfohalobiaceae bacterium]|nr:DUF4198 domain-containing protein [Desulfohalobiaceae bacterium]